MYNISRFVLENHTSSSKFVILERR